MKTWAVTVEAFGRISVQKVQAATRKEAEEKVLAAIGFRISAVREEVSQ